METQGKRETPVVRRLNRRELLRAMAGGGGSVLLLTLVGCQPAAQPTATSAPKVAPTTAAPKPTAAPTTAPPAVSGGTLKLALGANVDLNPIGVRTLGAFWLQSCMYDGLVISSANWEAVEPALAEKWAVTPDGLKYTFSLRKGVKWHDGKPFTATDVKFTYQTILTKAVGSYMATSLLIIKGAQNFFDGKANEVEGIKITDDHTIVFELDKPNAPFLFSILTQHSIIPEHRWKGVTPEELAKPGTWEKDLIGTGPFKFVKYETDKFVELARNDDAWRGKPLLDKILFTRVGTTPEATAIALEKGELDYGTIPATEVDRMSKVPNLTVLLKPVYNLRFLSINTAKPYFKDKRVRQAVAYGVDRRELCNSVLLKVCEPWNSIAPSMKWYNTNLPQYEYNPDKAAALLKEANWDPNQEIELSLYYNDQLSKDYIAAAQRQLSKIGMKAKVVQLDGSAVQAYYYTDKKFDIMYGGFGISPDMDEFRRTYGCEAGWPAGQNAMGYCNRRLDELFDKGAVAIDDAERKKAYDEAQAILADELPWVPLHLLKIVATFNKRVRNGEALANVWNRPYNWHVEKISVSDGR